VQIAGYYINEWQCKSGAEENSLLMNAWNDNICNKEGKMQAPMEREYCTVAEAALILHVSSSTVWRWIDSGILPAFRLGPKNIRIRKADLEAVVKPARPEDAEEGLWSGYRTASVRRIVAETSGSWSDVDADELIEDLYRAREEGSRSEESS
jgi:excisionase family DNA binding protein